MPYIAEEGSFLKRAHDVRTIAETRKFYSDWAETYDAELTGEHDYVQPRRSAEMLSRFLPDRGAAILDVGCDLTPGMLEKARERGIYRQLFEADLNRPPLRVRDGAYGAAVAVGVFSFSLIHPDALDEILRLLAPGAPLVIGVNADFYAEGTLARKLDALVSAGRIERLADEHGDHIDSAGVSGWAVAVRKAPAASG